MINPLMCLAGAIYFEARGEPIDGQIAVAEVVMNRVEDRRFPDTVCGVVKQNRYPGTLHRCQFSFYCNGQPETVTDWSAWHLSKELAQGVLDGTITLGVPATHYHAVTVDPFWSEYYTPLGKIGKHVFYYAGDIGDENE